MQDRIPTKPNRVLVTPESGEAFYATVTRADEPTNDGTPLNKGTLLSDETAEKFGLGVDGTVNNALALLAGVPRLNSGLGNEWLFEKKCDVGYEVYPSDFKTDIPVAFPDYDSTYYASDSYTYNEITGVYTLTNPTAIGRSSYSSFNKKYLVSDISKIRKNTSWDGRTYYEISAGAQTGTVLIEVKQNPTVKGIANGYYINPEYIESYSVKKIALAETTSFGYVNSPDENAYSATPDADGYYYKKIGQVGCSARIESGSYKGTGSKGSSGKNTLNFSFEPKLVVIVSETADAQKIFVRGQKTTSGTSSNPQTITLSWSGNSVSWYSTNYASQMNSSGTTYRYIAIG